MPLPLPLSLPPPEDISSLSVVELKRRLCALGISLGGMLEKQDLVERLIAAKPKATLPPAETASSSDNFLLAEPPLPPEELTLAKQAANTRSKQAVKQRSSRMAGWGGRRERNALVHQVALAEPFRPEIDDARLVREEWAATEKFDGIRAVWVPDGPDGPGFKGRNGKYINQPPPSFADLLPNDMKPRACIWR